MRQFLLALCACAPVWAQVTSGSISGYVLDPGRRPIGAAEVVVSDPLNGFSRHVTADAAGLYTAAGLPPAAYTVAASAPKFDRAMVPAVTVNVNGRVRLDLTLPLAPQRESVTVSGSASLLLPDTSELSTVFDRDHIRDLPLNRRDFLQLSLLAPGVAPPVENSELSTRGRFSMHALGAREEFNDYLLDGIDNNDQYENSYTLEPSVDAIQEFKIATGTYSAEYGRNAGAQVNVITRSGSNDWHGFAYSYARNRDLDARNFFDGSDKPELNRNQFGAGLGGPVLHDRTFFFVNYDGLREHQGLTRLGTVPTLAQRAAIPATASPVGLDVLNLFPLPNLPGIAGNFLAQPVLRDSTSQVNARVDHRISDADQLALRYSYGTEDLFEPYVHNGSDLPGFGDVVANTGHNALAQYQHVFSPGVLNSLRLGFNRAFRQVLPENYRTDVGALWNVPWLAVNPRDFGYPAVNASGFSLVGDAAQIPISRYTTTYQLSDGVSWIRGGHALKLGGEIRNVRLDGTLDYYARGSLSFSGAITGSGFGDLIAGYPSFGIQATFDNPQTLRTTAWNGYVQDDWKVRPNLTLNLGLRYEYNTPPVDPHDRMSVFVPAAGTIAEVGTHGVPRAGIRPDRDNFAPRAGFAWSPASNTVVRGGYGLYYEAGMLVVNSSLYFNPPYFNVRAFFPTRTSLLTLENPFPANGGLASVSPNTLSPDLTSAYSQNWSFALERQFGATRVTAAYAGSKGTDLIRSRDINQALPGPGTVALRRPLPQYGGIFFSESGANSSYQSMQLSLDRRFARRFSVEAAYTLAKSIDDASAFLGTQPDANFPQNSRDYRAERALSSFDVRHRLTSAWVVDAPGRVEIRGILTAQTGQPFTPYLRFDNSNTGNSGGIFGMDRPDVLHSPALANPGPSEWFDVTAFAVPAPYHFGNAGRNILTGPGLFSLDMAASRRFPIHERAAVSIDIEAFNLLNHTNFDLPERYADQPSTFGKIFSAKAPRQLQVALRFSF